MKSSILHLLSLALILSFSAACGKKSDGGSSSNQNANGYINPVGNGTNAVGIAGYNELVNWLNTADTSSGMRAFYVKKSGSMKAWFEMGLCQKSGINLPGCIKPTSCFVTNGSAVELGTTQFDNLRPQSCTLSGTFYSKANDTNLREAALGKSSGRVILKDRTIKNGNIYTVFYALYEGSTEISGAAQFNTSLPSVLNPIVLEENWNRTKTYYAPY